MHDGQTISTEKNAPTVQKQRYRTDKIAWVNGTEPHCLSIGTLISLVDTVIKHSQSVLTNYKIQGRTQVCFCDQNILHGVKRSRMASVQADKMLLWWMYTFLKSILAFSLKAANCCILRKYTVQHFV